MSRERERERKRMTSNGKCKDGQRRRAGRGGETASEFSNLPGTHIHPIVCSVSTWHKRTWYNDQEKAVKTLLGLIGLGRSAWGQASQTELER